MCGLALYRQNDQQLIRKSFQAISHRGPDHHEFISVDDDVTIGFHRLAIIDPSVQGNQPFIDNENDLVLVCNGEIYNYQKLKNYYSEYNYQSASDCEVLLPLFIDKGIKQTAIELDAEFAFCLYDKKNKNLFAARDPIGIRPLFYGKCTQTNEFCFASEAKALTGICNNINPFPPGHYFENNKFHPYLKITDRPSDERSLEDDLIGIRVKLTEGVRKRLHADVKVGFLLSGGLDSTLVCAIATKLLNKPITTFAIGMDINPIDLKYAKSASEYLGSIHHEVIFTENDILKNLEDVIYFTETWDVTSIRASIGMYLLCKYIKEQTDIKVILTGEISDELFGYKYTDFAPSADAFQTESIKRMDELYMYDVLRADRCISAHGLEARVPFGDLDFVKHVLSIKPEKKLNTYNKGKYLLRKAFDTIDPYLPEELLYREKAAFSDAVGHRLAEYLKEFAEKKYTDEEFAKEAKSYRHSPPITKEGLMYRQIFEQHYKGLDHLIKCQWMPNLKWVGKEVNDPSARMLPNYGGSGI